MLARAATTFPTLKTANLGFPRIGRQRQLKFALEGFWSGKRTEAELCETAKSLRAEHWKLQQTAGIDFIPSNDFSLYDQVLDMLVLLGATPERFGAGPVTLERYFAMARNSKEQTAMEMTKWFDTNYHYLVPEWTASLPFKVDVAKLLSEIAEARALGIETRPVLIGPLTLLLLGKGVEGFDPFVLAGPMVAAYKEVLAALAGQNVAWVQIDEPILATDLPKGAADFFRKAYAELAESPVKLMLTTYFDRLGDNLPLAVDANTAGLHIDLVRAPRQLEDVLAALKPQQILSLGCVEGRNIWLTDFAETRKLIESAAAKLGAERLIVAPSCSLLHVPHDLRSETKLPARIKSWMRFAEEKLAEIVTLANSDEAAYAANVAAIADRQAAESSVNPEVRRQLALLSDPDFARKSPYSARMLKQRAELGLPLFPTTTIGSFPQTAEVRKHRAAHKHGHESAEVYDAFLRQTTEDCIRQQEEIGLDVLVHGEFERNDMVEYFAEFLEGFVFTENGWVQSYGSRCVKPPVIFGDVWRSGPMTVKWSEYARSLTSRPVKGMLTGPITILQWSFVRNDIPRQQTAWQIALALRSEVMDLEAAGIRIIQVDEPALREGLPLRRADWNEYLDWAVNAFRLATGSAADETQIHTHMCYCEFADILPSIAALDADVISLESARSRMELLNDFRDHGYPNEIGPGVYDIHSPRVPSAAEMRELLGLAINVLRPEQIWVNPDCGLKTRNWPETIEALKNMCQAAQSARAALTA
ncbi:5-methyltetrahydropteroyltriglutamate--homocysteine S-methyltransferase [Edaphobacter sp. 12200R-103]|uniref:5-methyltetrahydropteroyltriglutamate-- homocysteine S-methyltransferase n=1 Tax=Edaphobacter sp. 12200R-103 TaxID=2703788 RepID=UPI00138B25B2|nr:5-methyltetrahydropteroyltriglutamate--homocysteine S-methyltransferase [Edaphobacter sp. 12200R-103]QHS52482.1 5-methyltetrahydropteroyltriglutamate--homocysteine S-methyltransferase [Edaphobacter sp. 12200R-103]